MLYKKTTKEEIHPQILKNFVCRDSTCIYLPAVELPEQGAQSVQSSNKDTKTKSTLAAVFNAPSTRYNIWLK